MAQKERKKYNNKNSGRFNSQLCQWAVHTPFSDQQDNRKKTKVVEIDARRFIN